ncbi:MAG TPA: DUF4838 domain-containing protein [Kiritimatiellia bacterium]|nr:DUF4838 domain-containing protein [Kiritimatiellia bacterium]
MKRRFRILAAAILPCILSAQDLTLATRGQPATYTLVRAAGASPSQVYAAEEFQTFTEKLTGVKLPLVTDEAPLPARAILLGQTRHTDAVLGAPADLSALGMDGFRIVTKPPHLLILGGPVRGTLYGVYETLERFGGCRWYSSWHSVIPALDAFAVPALDETQRPAFALREPFWFDMFDGDLAARNKANGNAMRLADKHGGHSHRFGGGLGSCHTFNALCPPEQYFDAHPEYFSEINGKRIKDHTQLCLTHPDVLRIVTSNVLARIRKDPGADFYGVSQNDWYNFCTCPTCKALDDAEESHAGTMIAFVNKVAEAVEKEFPRAAIETLAYQYTRKPPKTLRPRHNVMPCLCTIECDFAFPIDKSAFKENRSFLDDIRGWGAICDRLYVWDYTTNFRDYISPFPNVLALQDNVKFFRTNRVDYLFEQGAYQGRHGDFAELKAWLLAKWMWNPDLPQETLLQDFFSGYYGAAAPYVRTYFDALHSFYRDPEAHPLRIFEDPRRSQIPDGFYARAALLWQQAEAAVKDSPAHLYNVRMGGLPVLNVRLQRQPRQEEIKVWVTADPRRYEVQPETRALASELLARFAEAKNIRISEGAERHDTTIAQWKALATPPPLPPPQARAVVEDTVLSLGNRGTWGDTVADPLAEDGSAMKLYNTHYEWCTSLPFSKVAFDPGKKYRIRMRVRVEKEPGKEGEAFWSGVYDAKNKKGCGGCDRKASGVADGYQWYDVAEWVPEAAHYFWIGPGRFDKQNGTSAIKALYIDKLELARID